MRATRALRLALRVLIHDFKLRHYPRGCIVTMPLWKPVLLYPSLPKRPRWSRQAANMLSRKQKGLKSPYLMSPWERSRMLRRKK